MTAPAHGYVHASTPHDAELARLRLLERRYDEVTRTRLGRLGDLRGARCLEVGAGAGSVARMLSGVVGPDGSVVAADADPRFLTELEPVSGGAPIEVRRLDILVDELEHGGFDLVHCRALLLHLPDPEGALARMVAALCPGGWLLVEDADFTSFAADPSHPSATHFDRAITAMFDVYCAHAGMDMTLGARLPQLLDTFGLLNRGGEALKFRRRGGSPEADLFRQGFEHAAAVFGSARDIDESDLAHVLECLADPTFEFVDSLNVGGWGRRPEPSFLG